MFRKKGLKDLPTILLVAALLVLTTMSMVYAGAREPYEEPLEGYHFVGPSIQGDLTIEYDPNIPGNILLSGTFKCSREKWEGTVSMKEGTLLLPGETLADLTAEDLKYDTFGTDFPPICYKEPFRGLRTIHQVQKHSYDPVKKKITASIIIMDQMLK